MRKGLYRKGGELLVVIIAFVAEAAIPVIAEYRVATWISLYIVIMEAVSVLENLDQAGVLGNPTSYKAHSATRGAAIGTYNEWLFDVVCVHPDRDTINFFRFGIGEDRTVTVGGNS